MLHRVVISLMLMVFIVPLSVYAQETSTGATMRYTNTIESVTPQVTNNKLELLITGLLADGCQAETIINTQRVLDTWFIDLYRELPANTPCTKALLPFEVTVDATELLTLDANATLPSYLVVNGRIYYINRAQIEPSGENTPIIAPILSETIVRGEILLDVVTIIRTDDSTYNLQLTGNLPDGCRGLIVRSYPNWQNPTQMIVEAYRAIDIAAMCMASIVPFDETLITEADVATVSEFVINGVVYTIDKSISANTQSAIAAPMGVDTVQVFLAESFPAQYRLRVDGITDGCEFPTQVVQGQTIDNFIYVSVVRVVAPDQACTMIARPYDALLEINTVGLTVGTTYTVIVNNDKTVDFEFQG